MRSPTVVAPLALASLVVVLFGVACGDEQPTNGAAPGASNDAGTVQGTELRVQVGSGPFTPFSMVSGTSAGGEVIAPAEGSSFVGSVDGVQTVGVAFGTNMSFLVPRLAPGVHTFRFPSGTGTVLVGELSVAELPAIDADAEIARSHKSLGTRLDAMSARLAALPDGPEKTAMAAMKADLSNKLAQLDAWAAKASPEDKLAAALFLRDRDAALTRMDAAFDNVVLLFQSKALFGTDPETVKQAVKHLLLGLVEVEIGASLLAYATGPAVVIPWWGVAAGLVGGTAFLDGALRAIQSVGFILKAAFVPVGALLSKALADFELEEGVPQPIFSTVDFRRPEEGDTGSPVDWHRGVVAAILDFRKMLVKFKFGDSLGFISGEHGTGIPGGLAAVSVDVLDNANVKVLLDGTVDAPRLTATTTTAKPETFSFRLKYARAGFEVVSPTKTAVVSSTCTVNTTNGAGFRLVKKWCTDPTTRVQTLYEECNVVVNQGQPDTCREWQITTRDKNTKAERFLSASTINGTRVVYKVNRDALDANFIGEVLSGRHEMVSGISWTRATAYTGTTPGAPCTVTERSTRDGVSNTDGAFLSNGGNGGSCVGTSVPTGTPVADESAAVRAVNTLTPASSSLMASGKCGTVLTNCQDWLGP